MIACGGIPTPQDIAQARAAVANAIGCEVDDEPDFYWYDHGPINACARLNVASLGCALPDNTIHVMLHTLKDDTMRNVEHELVHWCLWRTKGNFDPAHSLSVWDNLGCRFAILPEQTY